MIWFAIASILNVVSAKDPNPPLSKNNAIKGKRDNHPNNSDYLNQIKYKYLPRNLNMINNKPFEEMSKALSGSEELLRFATNEGLSPLNKITTFCVEGLQSLCPTSNESSKINSSRQRLQSFASSISSDESEDEDDEAFVAWSQRKLSLNTDEDDSCASDSEDDDDYFCPSFRKRNHSTCSEDSFMVVFDEDEESGYDSNQRRLSCSSIDSEGDVVDFIGSPPNSSALERKKMVHFADEKHLQQVHVMVKWSYAYRMARICDWKEVRADQQRFAKRISDLENTLSPVLSTVHRNRIFEERFKTV